MSHRSLTVALTVAALAAIASEATTQEIHRWRTKDGRIFFGDKPPAGATDLGPVEAARAPKRGRVLTDEDVAADEARAVAPEPPAAAPPIEASRGSVLTDRDVAADAAKAAASEPTAAAPLAPDEARRLALASAVRIVATRATRGPKRWSLAGSVENAGPEIVHAVEIGAAGAWQKTNPPDIKPGEFATFALEIPAGKESAPPDVEVRWAEQ